MLLARMEAYPSSQSSLYKDQRDGAAVARGTSRWRSPQRRANAQRARVVLGGRLLLAHGGAIFQGADAQGRRTLLPSPAQRSEGVSLRSASQGHLRPPRRPSGLQEPGGPHVASIVPQCLMEALGSLVLWPKEVVMMQRHGRFLLLVVTTVMALVLPPRPSEAAVATKTLAQMPVTGWWMADAM